MYINLHLPLFNFAYLFFLFFLSFPLNIFVSFVFTALFPTWHLALVLFSSLCFNQFCSGRYNFWFPLFTGSIYCTLFLLDCFDFAYGCVCIFHYFNYYLPDFVTTICLGFILGFFFWVFVLISLNIITNHLWNLHS